MNVSAIWPRPLIGYVRLNPGLISVIFRGPLRADFSRMKVVPGYGLRVIEQQFKWITVSDPNVCASNLFVNDPLSHL